MSAPPADGELADQELEGKVALVTGAARGVGAATVAWLPLGRVAHPREIAEVIGFLATPRSSFITGAVVAADGGYTAA